MEGDSMKYLNKWDTDFRQILRCIGDTHDAQYKSVPEAMKIGDIFRVTEEFPPLSLNPSLAQENVIIHYYEYRICVFNFNKDEAYKFLAPKDWSDKQAIIYQFSK